jgi:BirA family transcriptional regulator, biotin operon repressor / biotin---[acetyl-CoA-carboxylase] ligase
MRQSEIGITPPATIGAPLDVGKIANQLTALRLGAKLHHFPELPSTNTHARELAENGASEGEVVIAEAQTAGRGRLGRRWESPAFANLYFSIILRPKLPAAHAPQITLMAAVALTEALTPLLTTKPAIKWPNDILVGGKKLAGVLTEAACAAERVEHVILGIGINVNYPTGSMPEEIRPRATSLMELAGGFVAREQVLARLIQALDRCYGELEQSGFDALRPRWDAHFGLLDQRVRIESLQEVFLGWARGVAQDGALLVEDDFGAMHTVYAGDVIPLET